MSLIASIAVGVLLIQLYRQSTRAQVGRAEAVVIRGCDLIEDRYQFYTAGWAGGALQLTDGGLRADLTAAVALALGRLEGVEGGIWQSEAGSVAYAYPTYQGTGPKTDLPAAEQDEIKAINVQAEQDDQPVSRRVASRTQTLLLYACPLRGPIRGLSGWTMTRVQSAAGLWPLQFGVGILLSLMVVMSAWLGHTLLVWGRHLRGIERALAEPTAEGMPVVPRTGERELDRVIDALNDAGRRLQAARHEAQDMASRVARAEHLAGLGRVAAGIAHEIRNPIAAARLQGENALAGDDARRCRAIAEMLQQVDRVDGHVAELLAMTQRVQPHPQTLDLQRFLREQAERHKEVAAAKRLTMEVSVSQDIGCLDPAVIGRVLDNLLSNAIRHAPEGGMVRLSADRTQGGLRLTVSDTGNGVPPEMRERLFEPFVTGRADGTGLGLAIARELVDAHGGALVLCPRSPNLGAVFSLTLPQEGPWRRS